MERNDKAVTELIGIMDRLLAPDGCPWDREQTHESLIRYLLEESYEVIEAIKSREMDKLKEELGDLLLQVVFHAALAQREGYFDFEDITVAVSRKMVGRHPHVFADLKLKSSNDVLERWEDFKKKEGKKLVLEGIPKILPALMRAEKMQEKAARVGFDWPDVEGALEKFKEEIDELGRAENEEQKREEFGDILFALVNVARLRNIEPEQALQAANDKFQRRFDYMERQVKEAGRPWKSFTLEELDILWDEAKNAGL